MAPAETRRLTPWTNCRPSGDAGTVRVGYVRARGMGRMVTEPHDPDDRRVRRRGRREGRDGTNAA
jgi:hypothetical protein